MGINGVGDGLVDGEDVAHGEVLCLHSQTLCLGVEL